MQSVPEKRTLANSSEREVAWCYLIRLINEESMGSVLSCHTDMQRWVRSYSTTQHPQRIQHWMRLNKTKGWELWGAVMVYTTVYQLVWLQHATYHHNTPHTLVHIKNSVCCIYNAVKRAVSVCRWTLYSTASLSKRVKTTSSYSAPW